MKYEQTDTNGTSDPDRRWFLKVFGTLGAAGLAGWSGSGEASLAPIGEPRPEGTAGSERASPPGRPPSFHDDFRDGVISGLWFPVVSDRDSSSVSEADGSLTVAGRQEFKNGINGNYYFAPDFELQATVELTAGTGKDGVALGGRGRQQLDQVPRDSRIYVSIHADGTVHLRSHESENAGHSATLSTTQGSVGKRFDVHIIYQASNERVYARIRGNDETSEGSVDASNGGWVSLAPWVADAGAAFSLHEVEVSGTTGFDAPFQVTQHERVVHREMVTNPPTDPYFPKEPAAVQQGETIYLAVAGFNGYESVEGDNQFGGGRVTEKDVTLWTSDHPLGEFEQISVVTDQGVEGAFDPGRKMGYQHAPGIGILDGELWVLYNQRVTDEIHAKHAPANDIPDRPDEWAHETLVGNASDVKSIIRHNGRVHVVFSNGSFEEVHLVSGDDLLSLGDRTSLVSTKDGYPGGPSGSNVAPHVFPGPDGGWYLLLTRRLGGGYSGHGGEVILYSDTLRGQYQPLGASNRARKDGRPGSHPDVWLAPGRVAGQILTDRNDGYIEERAAHAVFCFEAGQEALATRDGRYFGYFEGESEEGFQVGGFMS